MSMKRYAIIAAINHQHHQQQHQQQNATDLKPALLQSSTITPAAVTPTTATVSTSALDDTTSQQQQQQQQQHGSTATATTTYYSSGYGGGIGLYHQQNIRTSGISGYISSNGGSGSGAGGHVSGSGAYTHAINGNVNILLGGAMLSLVTTILCVVCYCCHRNIKKRTEAAYRQQRQWLDSDPNMEIYSVEQCYETSGLFLGESSDGLSALPALHHEPPPSYDAVVAMQEQQLLQQQQQQQQQLLLHHSPPPGYRSSLDVSMLPPLMSVACSSGNCSRGTPDGMAATLVSSASTSMLAAASTSHRGVGAGVGTACHMADCLASHSSTAASMGAGKPFGRYYLGAALEAQLNMKKVLNAHSCCSLQRAEVENMWNAAAAAVAARTHNVAPLTLAPPPPLTDGSSVAATVASSANGTPTMLLARKSLPAYSAGAKLAAHAVNELRSRYRQQQQQSGNSNNNYYRRGCPLCGKFRYDGDDTTLSLSTESGLDVMVTTPAAAAAAETVSRGQLMARGELDGAEGEAVENCQNCSQALMAAEVVAIGDVATCSMPHNMPHTRGVNEDGDIANGNAMPTNASGTAATTTTTTTTIDGREQAEGHEGVEQTSVDATMAAAAVDTNANATTTTTAIATADGRNNNNNNTDIATTNAPAVASACDSAAAASSSSSSPSEHSLNLDSINANGIVRVDMSRIIDQTGLPNYEAALKFESSGYV